MSRTVASSRIVLAAIAASLLLLPVRAWADAIEDQIVAQAPQVDDYLLQQMKSQHIPGLSVVVVRGGKLLLSRSYGLADVELQVPTSPTSVYEIASISKQFTATAIMMLVEEGKVKLDEKIPAYLTDLPAAWSDVTVRHLLTHTSGIPDYVFDTFTSFIQTARQDRSSKYDLDLVKNKPLEFTPGAKWDYCNTGYLLLGMIVQKVSGLTLASFLSQRIFQPLQMTATRANDLTILIPGRTRGYTVQGMQVRNAENWSPTQLRGQGDLISTVEDLAKWDAALYTEQLLTRASWEQMWTPVNLNTGKPARTPIGDGYGFGWFIHNYGKAGAMIHHAGGIPGFSTCVHRYLDDQVTTIVLPDTDNADACMLAEQVHRIVIRNLPASTP